MLGMKDHFVPIIQQYNVKTYCPNVVQTLSETELISILPEYEGWIIGDDPATGKVFEAGKKGRLKAAVKWGVGTDNVDFLACKELGIPIANTPAMFGNEVADVAIGYLIGLARETFFIDREVRTGHWPKNRGISLYGKTVGLVGYGDIGFSVAVRLKALGMKVKVYDPNAASMVKDKIKITSWPKDVDQCDFLVLTCSLNDHNKYMINNIILDKCKRGIRIINVARGGLVDELALCQALESGQVHSAALDVFEKEPLSMDSSLVKHPFCILGSHNASNTKEAVEKTNIVAIEKLMLFLGVQKR